MIYLDAYALLAMLRRERAAPKIRQILKGDEPTAVVSINLAEVVDTLVRRDEVAEEKVRETVAPLLEEVIQVIGADAAMAWRAAAIRGEHYRRRTSEVALADCFLLAAASADDAIATADKPVQKAARKEGIRIVALPQ